MSDIFFIEGQDGYNEGAERTDCPYDEGTDGQAGWRKGWDYEAAKE